jgi:hypothetical protein
MAVHQKQAACAKVATLRTGYRGSAGQFLPLVSLAQLTVPLQYLIFDAIHIAVAMIKTRLVCMESALCGLNGEKPRCKFFATDWLVAHT